VEITASGVLVFYGFDTAVIQLAEDLVAQDRIELSTPCFSVAKKPPTHLFALLRSSTKVHEK